MAWPGNEICQRQYTVCNVISNGDKHQNDLLIKRVWIVEIVLEKKLISNLVGWG